MPTEPQRAAIAASIRRIEQEITTPAAERDVVANVVRLLVAFPAANMSPEAARARASIYVSVMADLPGWAIRIACDKWLRGDAEGNLAFAPSPPQLRQLAEAQTLSHRAAIVKLRRVLDAVPMEYRAPSEDRAAIAAKFGGLVASIAGKARDEKSRTAQYQDETAKKVRA